MFILFIVWNPDFLSSGIFGMTQNNSLRWNYKKRAPGCQLIPGLIEQDVVVPVRIPSIIKWIYSKIISTTGWIYKIVVLKKTTLQLYFKTFIEKINSANLIMQ